MFLEVFDTSKRPFRARVGAAAQKYYSRHQEFPNLVFVPAGERPAHVWRVKVTVAGTEVVVRVEEREGLASGTLYVGFEENPKKGVH